MVQGIRGEEKTGLLRVQGAKKKQLTRDATPSPSRKFFLEPQEVGKGERKPPDT